MATFILLKLYVTVNAHKYNNAEQIVIPCDLVPNETTRRAQPMSNRRTTRKSHVQNKTSEIDTFSSQVCFNVNRVSNTNQHQPNEEPNKVVPHTTTKLVHVQDCWNGTNKQRPPPKGHKHGVLCGEPDSAHQRRQVVHNSVVPVN